MDRRSFIKLTAITTSSAALASCGNPEHQFIRFVPAEDIVPGIATYKPGVCPLCASGCGLTVRVMDADAEVTRDGQTGVVAIMAAKKLEGAPTHPVNRGGLCARGQAAIQITYHPDRITQPLRRTGERGTGQYEAIAWDAAIAELTTQLDALAAAGNQKALGYLARRGASRRSAITAAFLATFGAPPAATFELFGDDVLRRANAISFGRPQLPTFDLANARYVINFGSDLLGTWNSPVAHARAYGEMRQGRRGVRGTFVQVEPRMSQTGANADEWVPAKPGSEGVLALGLAQLIVSKGLRPGATAPRDLSAYTPEAVQQATGVDPRRLERLATELAESSPAVAIVGGAPLAHTNGLFTALAVNTLNQVLGAIGQPGGVHFTPQDPALAQAATEASSLPALLASNPQVLFIDGANPVYSAPVAWKVRETLARVPFIVSFGSFLDDTSALADLILPDHSFLESWVDASPESGALTPVASLAQPAMRPLYDTRSTPDVLLEISRGLATPLELPWMTYDEMLGASFGEGFIPALEQGWTDAVAAASAPASGTRTPASAAIDAPADTATFDGDASQFPYHFLPYPSSQFGDGAVAHLPWLQEMPDPLTSGMWSSWVEINPRTAEQLGVQQGDVVEIASTQASLRAPVVLFPGIAPDVIAMPVGQGHEMFTRYASKRGANATRLIAPVTEAATGALAWAATRVRVARAGDADGSLILFAGGDRELQHGR